MTGTGLAEREIGISWSRLREHMECPQHAHLKDQGKKAPVTDIRVFFPGTVVDRCMRRWLEQEVPQPGQMAAWCAEIMETEERAARETKDGIVKWRSREDKAEVLANCIECLTRLEPILSRLVLPYDYEPAARFRVPLLIPYLDGSQQRIWLVGEMDLLTGCDTRHGRMHEVWDLKMTADNGYWRKTTGQLLFYDLAVLLMAGRYPVRCGLIQPMCAQQELAFTFTGEQRRELLMHISRYCAAVWRRDFPLRPTTDRCGFCDTKHACPRYAGDGGGGRVPWPVLGA